MPWKESSVLDQRLAFINMVLSQELNIAQACREFGISRPTGYQLLERFALQGEAGLCDRSRAPWHHPQAVEAARIDRIIALRARFPTWGPKKIKAYLQAKHPNDRWPAASTIGDRLKQAGLVPKRRFRHRAPAAALTPIREANQIWCADFKGQFRLGNGRLCYPLTLTDAASRYLLRCQALTDTRACHAWPVFVGAFQEFGLPDVIRTDNGSPFASSALGGLCHLSLNWIKLGIRPERIAPGHPEQNGRHERLHKTLKADTINPPQQSFPTQQRCFDAYRTLFNNERPHEALEQKPPASCYAASLRPYPKRLPSLQYPQSMRVRKVHSNGCVRLKGRDIFVSEVLIGEPVGLDAFMERLVALYVGPLPLAILDEANATILPPKKAAVYLRQLQQETEPYVLNV